MTKPLYEVVRETHTAERQFVADADLLLERLASPDPGKDDSNLAKLYARTILSLGNNCDEMVSAAIEKRESAQ